MKRELHVAAAVIRDAEGRVLITQRPPHKHQGGCWEFPGGKVEAEESVEQALRRELEEELGIRVLEAEPLIRIPYEYPEHRVVLDVWQVMRFEGEAHGREGQPLRWVGSDDLRAYTFPAANLPIIAAARLPDRYLITPEPGGDASRFLLLLEQSLRSGIRLVQLRCKTLGESSYVKLARQALELCARYRAQLLLNAAPELLVEVPAHGVHLSSAQLWSHQTRPVAADQWLAASCHTERDLHHARAIGVDFAVVSPVHATATHPDAAPLGWESFARLAAQAGMPVYALGGMGLQHLAQAKRCGAQGIAAISALWGAH
ncbi:MAG: Nudix family hydrolase [Pseudomonadota bacterium]